MANIMDYLAPGDRCVSPVFPPNWGAVLQYLVDSGHEYDAALEQIQQALAQIGTYDARITANAQTGADNAALIADNSVQLAQLINAYATLQDSVRSNTAALAAMQQAAAAKYRLAYSFTASDSVRRFDITVDSSGAPCKFAAVEIYVRNGQSGFNSGFAMYHNGVNIMEGIKALETGSSRVIYMEAWKLNRQWYSAIWGCTGDAKRFREPFRCQPVSTEYAPYIDRVRCWTDLPPGCTVQVYAIDYQEVSV